MLPATRQRRYSCPSPSRSWRDARLCWHALHQDVFVSCFCVIIIIIDSDNGDNDANIDNRSWTIYRKFWPSTCTFRSRETAGQVATFVSARGNTESFFILFLWSPVPNVSKSVHYWPKYLRNNRIGVASVLDSGAEGPGFKSQSGNSRRQTVHTHRASVHQAAKLVAAFLRAVSYTHLTLPTKRIV